MIKCYTFKFIYACTALSTEPLSDSVNYQDTTEGTGYYRGYRILQRVQDTTE